MPAPTPIPLMGELFNIFRKVNLLARFSSYNNVHFYRVCTRTIWISFKNMVKSLGKSRGKTSEVVREISCRVYEAHTPIVLVSDPELLRKILIKHFHIFTNRRVSRKAYFDAYLEGYLLTGYFGRCWSSRTWSHAITRRTMEKCTSHCVTNILYCKTQSSKFFYSIKCQPHHLLSPDVRIDE